MAQFSQYLNVGGSLVKRKTHSGCVGTGSKIGGTRSGGTCHQPSEPTVDRMEFHSPAGVLHCQQWGGSERFRRCLVEVFPEFHKSSIKPLQSAAGQLMILKQARSLRKETCWADRLAKTNYLGLGRQRLPRRKETCSNSESMRAGECAVTRAPAK